MNIQHPTFNTQHPMLAARGRLLVALILLHTLPSPGNTWGQSAAAESDADNAWAFSAYAFTYFPPEDDTYVQPTFTADRDWLHLEARYNYEDLDTASVWAGYNFGGGEEITWSITPMLGGVFGETSGVAPGYRGSLGWWWLELYSEGEYVFATGASAENFFYNWSELSLAPVDWVRFGLVTQRTRVYGSDREIERGLLLGFSWRMFTLTGYVFNPDDDPTWVASFGLDL